MWMMTSVILLASATDGASCTCIGEWPSLKKLIHELPLVTAEVLAQGQLNLQRLDPDLDIAYLDVRIIKRVRGKEQRATIRVWDPSVGTSCSNQLRELRHGTYVALGGSRRSAESKELLDALEIDPASDDYLLGACGTYYERLESAEAAHRFPKKVRQR